MIRFFRLGYLLCLTLALAAATPLEKVSLQLQWLDQFQFAGYYMAVEKGYYREAGLDVTLKPFQFGMLPSEEVISGRADYGTGRSSLLIDRINNKPVVALAAIFQSSPNVLLARKDSGIKSIKDFKGKRIMLTRDAQDSITYQAMLNSEGLTFDDVVRQEHTFNLDDLIQGRTDLMACYLSNEPFRMQERHVEPIGFAPKDYGFDFYSDILFTSEQELQDHPKRVEAFLMASIKGWHYAFDHIDETVDTILAKYNSQNKSRESLIFEAKVFKQLAYSNDLPLGHIAIDKFKAIYDLYRVMGMVAKPLDNMQGFIYRSALNAPFELTAEEKDFLRLNTIKAISTGYGPPFEHAASTHNGYPLTAIAYDFWMHIVDRHHIATDIKHAPSYEALIDAVSRRRADIALSIDNTGYTMQKCAFSKPYGSFSYVIATRDDVSYIPNLAALEGKKIAIRRSAGVLRELMSLVPHIQPILTENSDDAVDLLRHGHVYAVVELLPLLSHLIEHKQYDTVKISGTTDLHQSLRFIIRNDYPELLSIVNKSIDAIPLSERTRIFSRYNSPRLSDSVNYMLVLQIVLGALAIIAVLVYRQYLLSRHNKMLLNMASTDKLTHVYNRVKLDQSLAEYTTAYRRTKRPYALILLDIDDFKQVNDRYGHLSGDRALVALTEVLRSHLRRTDVLGRWGGEEFLIICQNTDANGAQKLAEALQTIVADTDIEGIGHLQCSFGVTEIVTGDTTESIVKRVDDALYEAKNAGKNRVAVL
jgi:polar amino acid transport system substrate-binding protein